MFKLEGKDGVDFINIYSKGETSLGRFLSNFTRSEFTVAEGTFQSVEGYWYYLSYPAPILKSLYGYQAKKRGKELREKATNRLSEDEFRKKIKLAINAKLKAYPSYLEDLRHSTLPFVHYYEYNGKRIDAGFYWIVEHIETVRTYLKKAIK